MDSAIKVAKETNYVYVYIGYCDLITFTSNFDIDTNLILYMHYVINILLWNF